MGNAESKHAKQWSDLSNRGGAIAVPFRTVVDWARSQPAAGCSAGGALAVLLLVELPARDDDPAHTGVEPHAVSASVSGAGAALQGPSVWALLLD